MYGYRFETIKNEKGKVTGEKMVFPTGKTDEERDKKHVTETEFMKQMHEISSRCNDVRLDVHRSLIWNTINTVLIVITALISVLT